MEVSNAETFEQACKVSRFYKYTERGFKDIFTNEYIESVHYGIGGKLAFFPDLKTQWSIKVQVNYKICIPFKSIKGKVEGFDKYGNKFRIIDMGCCGLMKKDYPDAVVSLDHRCERDNYVMGVFPNSNNPIQKHILPYCYDGIMLFKSTPKILWGNRSIAEYIQKKKEIKLQEDGSLPTNGNADGKN